MSEYAEIVGTAPAEMREVKATLEGRIVQSSTAPKTAKTVTAFFGRPSGVTCPIQLEPGRTPSRATAKMSRDAATMATDELMIRPMTCPMPDAENQPSAQVGPVR